MGYAIRISTFVYSQEEKAPPTKVYLSFFLSIHGCLSEHQMTRDRFIDDYIELEELVNKIVAENIQQEIDKEDEEGQVYLDLYL